MKIFGPKELLEDVHKRSLCIGCGACVNLCPYFENYRGSTALLFPCSLSEGRCYAFCPKVELDLDELSTTLFKRPYDGSDLGFYQDILVSHAGPAMGEAAFQAGGTVSALIAFALKTNVIDAGVLTDREGVVPLPRLATKAEEVTKYAMSKYMAAPTLSGLNRGVREGYLRIGVVGTPCQVMAIGKMRVNSFKFEREGFQAPVALVVGLFCTWALDTRKSIAFISERVDVSRIRKMDIPPPPAEVFIIDMGNEELRIPLKEIRPLVPKACHVCPDMTSQWADISVGDLEGAPGWNTVIVRTEKGEQLIREAAEARYLVLDKISEQRLNHLSFAAANKKKRALSLAQEKGLLDTSEDGEGKRAALRIPQEIVEDILA